MNQAVEFSLFLGLAVAAHLMLVPQTRDGSVPSEGGGGDGSVVLMPSTPTLSQLVAEWTRPPDVAQDVAMSVPDRPARDLARPQPISPPALAPRMLTPVLPAPERQATALPRVDPTPPAPPRAASDPTPRPQTRPERAAPQPTSASRSQARETAAGQGRRQSAGSTQTAADPSTSVATQTAALSQWGARIRGSIERRKRYPSGTRANGTVTLAIAVQSAGRVSSVAVARSSGHAALDRAALTAVQRARIPAAPSGVAPGIHSFVLRVSFAR
ncbi:TonB family protein [Aestuariivita sp.]|jgi:protein TonB|uniref:TonB family protein n=1 Tax=Aestuariivita sp. TaxID=1872407 RepID=UPI00216F80FB|nr:TonB family protein [Aestuariivita sp.]MCE8009007.1 energy transducer TonB [Aestuariivita sp.]